MPRGISERSAMSERMKNGIIITAAVSCLALAGIFLWLIGGRDEVPDPEGGQGILAVAGVEVEEVELSMPDGQDAPVEELREDVEAETVEVPEIEFVLYDEGNPYEQLLQETPTIPDVPDAPPELKEDADITNSDEVPEYEETKPRVEETPQPQVIVPPADEEQPHSPNAVYFPGFGWVEYSGPSYTIDAPDMYMNGNKIGDM